MMFDRIRNLFGRRSSPPDVLSPQQKLELAHAVLGRRRSKREHQNCVASICSMPLVEPHVITQFTDGMSKVHGQPV